MSKVRKKSKARPVAKRKPRPAKRRAVARRAEMKPREIPKEAPKELPPERVLALVIRLKGDFSIPENVRNTLTSLKLHRKFSAVLLEKTQNLVGLLRGLKDYVTWGELGAEDIAALLKDRGRVQGDARLTDDFVKKTFGEGSVDGLAAALVKGRIELKEVWRKGVKRVFRLRPPSGGFDYSIKRPFGSYGELGYRGQQISNLVIRMR